MFLYSRSHIEKAGHTCELRDAAEFQSPANVADLLSQNPPFQGAIAIHLFRAGKLLLGKPPCFLHDLKYLSFISPLHVST